MFYWRLLTNEQLVDIYQNARKASLDDQLIQIIVQEIHSRGIVIPTIVPSLKGSESGEFHSM